MYTLKIHQDITDEVEPLHSGGPTTGRVEELTMFFPARRVTCLGGFGPDGPRMTDWAEGSYVDYSDVHRNGSGEQRGAARLIETIDDEGNFAWYLVSHAWLLGPDGRTIERLAP